jgi:hypothetical protein
MLSTNECGLRNPARKSLTYGCGCGVTHGMDVVEAPTGRVGIVNHFVSFHSLLSLDFLLTWGKTKDTVKGEAG